MERVIARILLCVLGVALAVTPLAASAAPPQAVPAGQTTADQIDCAKEQAFDRLRDNFIARTGQVSSAPATMILPADLSARFLIKQPMGTDADARSFRVFEVNKLDLAHMTGVELSVLSVDPAAASAPSPFRPADSVSLQTDIPQAFPPWLIRTFVIVACKGKQFGGWGSVTAPVSHPAVTLTICIIAGILAYVLGMLAVFAQRFRHNDLEIKYPAIFAARPLVWYDFFNPILLAENAFHQGSVQKTQVLLFSFLIGELVLSMVLRTGTLVDLSATVLGLLGISGIGAVAAQAAYQQKTRLSFENWAWLEHKGVLQTPAPSKSDGPYWRDLVLTNREFDVYKLQTIIFTVAVASALIVGGASHLSSFAVPESLLGVLGLSQVVYVGGVLVKPPAVGDLDAAITKLRAAGEALAGANAQNLDTDANGRLLAALPAGQPVGANAQRQYDDLADSVVAMIESALEVPADRTKL